MAFLTRNVCILAKIQKMKFENIYFINGNAYAGKSTMVKLLAERHNGICCEENYHNKLLGGLNKNEFPALTYTRDLQDWALFIRRTPDEYAAWIDACNNECTKLEIEILTRLSREGKKIFVDTNIPTNVLHEISDTDHTLIMLADPQISVSRFFDRPDKEKQFIYQLLLAESDPDAAIKNYRAILEKINSQENYNAFKNSGFNVIFRDEERSIEDTLKLVERALKLSND